MIPQAAPDDTGIRQAFWRETEAASIRRFPFELETAELPAVGPVSGETP